MENWKPVRGYENLYEISDMGRLKSKSRKTPDGRILKDRIVKLFLNKEGYYQITLYDADRKKNKRMTFLIHRLVASHFCKGTGANVDHINGVKTDNRSRNLEWVSVKENVRRASELGLRKNTEFWKFKKGPVNKKTVECVNLQRKFDSSYSAAEWINVTKFQGVKKTISIAKNIRACCSGKQSTAFGYRWKHYSEEFRD